MAGQWRCAPGWFIGPAMTIRAFLLSIALAGTFLTGSCGEPETGPIVISAIGGKADLANPNLEPLDPPTEFLLLATAQGLLRFDAAGQVEPALAQSWIVSDDGLRYTFRLARTEWNGGDEVTAEQVVARLRAAISPASDNPLKPLLGVVDEIVPMTDDVLEISLKSPRPNFLQLLAQPELAILWNGAGSGPYQAEEQGNGSLLLAPPPPEEEEEEEVAEDPQQFILRGERAAMAVARFVEGRADLVIGGTAGDLPLARSAEPAADALVFDPVAGLFGLEFVRPRGPLEDADVRRALSMAIDRADLVTALGVPDLAPRTSLVPAGVDGLPDPIIPGWEADPMPMRREAASSIIASAVEDEPLTIRVAMPEGPGYRLIFAHLRRDWRAIGVDAERVGPDDGADLRLVDAVAPINLASWYLRHFTCDQSAVCDKTADEMLEAARIVQAEADRRLLLTYADRLLADANPFIPLTAPVRWSLVSPRLTAFRPNVFNRHGAAELIAPAP